MFPHNVGFFSESGIDDDIFKIIPIPGGVVTASRVNKEIKVWRDYACEKKFIYPSQGLLNDIILLNPDEIAACGSDGAVWILNLREATMHGPFFKMDKESILAITALSNAEIIFSCCSGLYLGDLANGEKHWLTKLNNVIRELIFLERFGFIACFGEDCIYICDLRCEVIATFKLDASVSIMRDDSINSRLFAVDKLSNIYILNLCSWGRDCFFLQSEEPRIISIAPVSKEAFFTIHQEGMVYYWVHENETWHSHKCDKLPSPILSGAYLGFKHNWYVPKVAQEMLPRDKFYIILNEQNKQNVLVVAYRKNGKVISRPLADFLPLFNDGNMLNKQFFSRVTGFPDVLKDPALLIMMAEKISPSFDTVNVRAAIYDPAQRLLIAGLHDGRITSWTLNPEGLALQLTRSLSYCRSSSSAESLPLDADKSDGHDSDPSFQMQ